MHGLVQGVFFRTTSAEEARRLRVTGRVWNRSDGSVECVAEGEPDALDRFREWLGRGPPHARVERVDVTDLDGGARYREFAISRGPAD